MTSAVALITVLRDNPDGSATLVLAPRPNARAITPHDHTTLHLTQMRQHRREELPELLAGRRYTHTLRRAI